MSKIGTFKIPTRQSFPDIPPWFENAMRTVWQHIIELTEAIQRTPNEEEKELTVRHGVEYRVDLDKLKGPPRRAAVEHSSLYDYAHLKWSVISEKQVKFTVKFDSTAPSGDVVVRIVFRGA